MLTSFHTNSNSLNLELSRFHTFQHSQTLSIPIFLSFHADSWLILVVLRFNLPWGKTLKSRKFFKPIVAQKHRFIFFCTTTWAIPTHTRTRGIRASNWEKNMGSFWFVSYDKWLEKGALSSLSNSDGAARKQHMNLISIIFKRCLYFINLIYKCALYNYMVKRTGKKIRTGS